MTKRVLAFTADFFMTCLGVIPTIYLIITTFGCTADEPVFSALRTGGILPFILLFCLLWTLFWSGTRHWYLTLPVLAAVLFFALRKNITALIRGADTFLTKACDLYDRVFNLNLFYRSMDNADCAVFFIVVAFLLSFLVSMSVTIRRGKTLYSVLTTMSLFIMCAAVNSWPNTACCMALLMFWALSLAAGRFTGAGNPLAARTIAVLLLPTALLLGVIFVNVNPSEYEYTDEMRQQAESLDNAFQKAIGKLTGKEYESPEPTKAARTPDVSDGTAASSTPAPAETPTATSPVGAPLPATGFWTGTDRRMDISGQGGLHQTGGVVFSVASTLSGRVYLRSLTYGDYTGSGWKEANYDVSELADKYAYTAVSAASGASRGTLAVTRVGDVSGLFHLPYYNNGEYYFDTGGSGIYSLSELRSYSVDYIKYTGDYSDAVLTGADAEAEASTREAIYEAYTTLPDATKSAMLDIARENNLISDSADIINEVAAFVKNSAVYDLNISPMPDGEDCAVYFLTQSHRGYCIHFATAAAVMYRALGIPARVVSGFMFTTVADELVSVTDKDAHAWTEVYMDGVGWIPVEATGSTAAGATDSGEAERTANQPPVGIASMDDSSGNASILSILLKILIPALVVCAVIFWRIPANAVRSRVFSGRKSNRAMVQIWKYARRVGRFGLPIPEVIQAGADRACFSRDGVSREELVSAVEAAGEYARRTYAGLSPVRRFVFKYILGLR